MNGLIILIFGFQLVICAFIGIMCGVWNVKYSDEFDYFIDKRYSSGLEAF